MRISLLGLAVLLSACAVSGPSNGESFGLDFDVDPDDVAPGDSVTLELENESESSVSYNLCSSTLEMETESTWTQLPSDRMCTRELRGLAPGEEAQFRLQLPADLQEGTYRFTTGVHVQEGAMGQQVPSETFVVRR